jgi:hypothetical protein
MKPLPVLLITAALLSACGDRKPDLVAMRIELTALKQELELIRQHAEEFEPRLRSAEEFALKFFDERAAAVRLDCLGQKVSVMPTSLATLSIVCEDTRATVGGQRLRLRLGNPTSARLDRLGLTFYGASERGQSDHRVHVELATQLPPGSWTRVDVDVPGLGEGDLAELAIRAQVGAMILAQK